MRRPACRGSVEVNSRREFWKKSSLGFGSLALGQPGWPASSARSLQEATQAGQQSYLALPGFKWAKEPDRVSHRGSRWR